MSNRNKACKRKTPFLLPLVCTMREGEVAAFKFTIGSALSTDSASILMDNGESISRDTVLVYVITIVRMLEYKRLPPETPEQHLQYAEDDRREGNEHYRDARFQDAKKLYQRVCV